MKNEKPLVTVPIVCYKNFKYLFEVIDSVLEQDYERIEFIISDDGSDGFVPDIYSKYINENKRSNIISYQVIKHDTNQGTVKHCNEVWGMAKGKYIVSADCDGPFVNSHVISDVVAYMEEEEKDIVLCARIECDENLKNRVIRPEPYELKKIQKLISIKQKYRSFMCSHMYGILGAVGLVYTTELFKKYGPFDERYVLLEDAPFIANLLKNNVDIDFNFNIIYAYYRRGGISTTELGANKIYFKDCQNYHNNESAYAYQKLNWIEKYIFNLFRKYYLRENHSRIYHLIYLPAIILTEIQCRQTRFFNKLLCKNKEDA